MGAVFRKWSQMSLVLRILIGLLIGAVLGLTVPHWTAIDILGIVFVSALKAIAPILVAVLVTASIAKAGDGLGPRFRTVISRYMLSTFIAALCAVVGSFLFPVTLQLRDVVDQVAPGAITDIFTNLLANMVINPMMSVSQANYIGILFWAILAGIALKMKASQQTINMVSDFSEVITLTVKWVIQFAPFGILGLVFSSVSESGLQAFFTRSSAANIPINLNLCKKLGLDEDFYSVSIPLAPLSTWTVRLSPLRL